MIPPNPVKDARTDRFASLMVTDYLREQLNGLEVVLVSAPKVCVSGTPTPDCKERE